MFGIYIRGCELPNEPTDPWSDELLRQTANNYPGVGADAGQPDSVRFLRGVARLVKKRLKLEAAVAGTPSVFLLCPAAPQTIDKELLTSYPMLDNGQTPVEGKLWIVGNPVVTAGRCMALGTLEDGELFELIVSSFEQGDVPAVIYDPRPAPAQIRYYPSGLRNEDDCEVFDIPTTERVALQDILEVVNHVCERQLVTPDGQSEMGKLWADPSHHLVASKAEQTIQMYLVSALNGAFPTCEIRFEQPDATGRLDIEVEESDYSGGFIRHAILELKVLRSYGSNGGHYSADYVRNWVAKGVDQAYSYRVKLRAAQSALCCFDMRTSHSDTSAFEEIAEKASALDVVIRWWGLFASSEAYRSYLSAYELSNPGAASTLLVVAT